jgi:4-amino-4-deoxy-L-arabinose transferase-like glycosyltransferase
MGIGDRKKKLRAWGIAAAVFSVALLVRCAFVLVIDVKPIAGGDPGVYKETALHIRSEGIPYSSEGHAFRPPLYPYFVALAGAEGERGLFLAQAAVGALSAALLYGCLRRWGESTALVGAFLFIAHPLMLFYAEQTLTESVYISLLLAATWFSLRALDGGLGWCVASGAAMGLAVLCRSEAVVVSALFLAGLGMFKRGPLVRRLAGVALATATAAGVVAPWLVRNCAVVGGPVLATEGGYTLYLGNNPEATGGYYVLKDAPEELSTGELARDRYYKDRAIDYLFNHPATWGSLLLKKQRWLWASHGNWILDSADLLFAPLAVGGLALAVWKKERWVTSYFLLAPVVSMLLIASVFIGQVRFRTSSYPFLIAFGSIFLTTVLSQVRSFVRKKPRPIDAGISGGPTVLLSPIRETPMP